MLDKRFAGKFGMFEEELAAQRIYNILIEQNRTSFSVSDFNPENGEANGFVELVWNEWVEKPYPPYNGSFTPTYEFWQRIGLVIIKSESGLLKEIRYIEQ